MQVVVARHKNEHPYVYATSRDCVVFRIETLRGSLKECTLIHWARTNPELRNTVKMCCTQRDSQTDYYQCKIHFSKVARYRSEERRVGKEC